MNSQGSDVQEQEGKENEQLVSMLHKMGFFRLKDNMFISQFSGTYDLNFF